MKITGVILTIIGAICTVYGYVQTTSLEYQFFGGTGAPQVVLYGGIVVLIIGIILLVTVFSRKRK